MAVPSVRLRTGAPGCWLVIYDEIITVVQVLQEADIVGIVITVVELAVNVVMNSIYLWEILFLNYICQIKKIVKLKQQG